ncbi:hypothetical protein T10_4238 [Trichinella papuae]|uniref:Uncharacterized protein n=1 Tax=Trichinella papuae TaxID=268474 RepID=A0A0V1MFA9_9BILA|nr:hypothetical protein T10_4238 [Trichinella papuae]
MLCLKLVLSGRRNATDCSRESQVFAELAAADACKFKLDRFLPGKVCPHIPPDIITGENGGCVNTLIGEQKKCLVVQI